MCDGNLWKPRPSSSHKVSIFQEAEEASRFAIWLPKICLLIAPLLILASAISCPPKLPGGNHLENSILASKLNLEPCLPVIVNVLPAMLIWVLLDTK